jgi:transcriptional regulator with XRE-family HTH domain
MLSWRSSRPVSHPVFVDFLSLVERGVDAPSFETLEKMAKHLRLPVAEFFMFG